MGQRKYDWDALKAMFIAGHTAREIAAVFGCHPQLILNKSKAEGWGKLRRQLKALPPRTFKVAEAKVPNLAGAKSTEIGFEVERTSSELQRDSTKQNDSAFARALKIRSSDNFRNRVIEQADKALSTLEKAAVNNVYETDRFAEALTKVERIGARAYGYDREAEHPIINIGILGSGAEYEQT